MKVFISWSGEVSRQAALKIYSLIENCLAPLGVWMSDVDMEAGVKWFEEIEKHLNTADIGIICLTEKSIESKWVLFEAGAMLKAKKLIPYLVELTPKSLPGPLSQYQACESTRQGKLKLIHSINKETDQPVEEAILKNRFDAFLPETTISDPDVQYPLGVIGIFPDRITAFDMFVQHLEKEVNHDGHSKRIWIVGSSFHGFNVSNLNFSRCCAVLGNLEEEKKKKYLRFVLTDPEHSHYREKPEKRRKGQIKGEIEASLWRLINEYNVPAECIKLYPGTPTVSAIATSAHMLLNPYPYGESAYFLFSLIVKKMPSQPNIYDQYIDAHFKPAWEFGAKLTKDYIDSLKVE